MEGVGHVMAPLAPESGLRNRMGAIEAVELGVLSFAVFALMAVVGIMEAEITLVNVLATSVLIIGALFILWGSYNLYIRLARAGGGALDVGLWVIAAAATASVTFWAWSIFDVNRWIMAKLFYRGAAPVEYAWSAKSKQRRKAWELARKAVAMAQAGGAGSRMEG